MTQNICSALLSFDVNSLCVLDIAVSFKVSCYLAVCDGIGLFYLFVK